MQYAICKQNGNQAHDSKITVKVNLNTTERNKIRSTSIWKQNENIEITTQNTLTNQTTKRTAVGVPVQNDTTNNGKHQKTMHQQQTHSSEQGKNINEWTWPQNNDTRQQQNNIKSGQQVTKSGKNRNYNTTTTRNIARHNQNNQTPYNNPIGKSNAQWNNENVQNPSTQPPQMTLTIPNGYDNQDTMKPRPNNNNDQQHNTKANPHKSKGQGKAYDSNMNQNGKTEKGYRSNR